MNFLKLPVFLSGVLLTSQIAAGEVVFYVTEEGAAVNNVAVTFDGDKQLVGKNGFAVFDSQGGDHFAEFSQLGAWVGETEFSLSADQSAEVQVELIAGEALAEVQAYVPGQEETPALGNISGMVTSAETGGGVVDARISVAGTEVAAATDQDGFFALELPRGSYQLKVAHPEYGNRDIDDVRVISNVASQINLTMSMSGDSVIEEVVAVGSYIPSTATASERDSSAVLDAIGAEQLSRFGDSNAASALKRVAGVSIEGGRYAVVRGLNPRYNTVQLNGGNIPSSDPSRRVAPLDIFPSSVISGLEVQKSRSVDTPSGSTGGAITVNTRKFPADYESKLSLSLGGTFGLTGSNKELGESESGDFFGFGVSSRDMSGAVSEFERTEREGTFPTSDLERAASKDLTSRPLDLSSQK